MAQSLKHVLAAQLRARATRGALGNVALGFLFLVGTLAYSLAPDKHAESSVTWMSLLLVLSTFNIARGMRMLARLQRRSPRLWIAATAAWGLLSVTLVRYLLEE